MGQEMLDRLQRYLSDFKLHRSPRLDLDNGTAVATNLARTNVIDLQSDQVAGAKLTVDSKIEQRDVPKGRSHLESNSNGLNLTRQ